MLAHMTYFGCCAAASLQSRVVIALTWTYFSFGNALAGEALSSDGVGAVPSLGLGGGGVRLFSALGSLSARPAGTWVDELCCKAMGRVGCKLRGVARVCS